MTLPAPVRASVAFQPTTNTPTTLLPPPPPPPPPIMSSHVPFLTVRPDDQFSSAVKRTARDVTRSNTSPPQEPMDSPPHLTPAPPRTYAASRLPSAVRFPLLVMLSFSLSTLIHTFTAEWSGLQLATASRKLDDPLQIAGVLGWKVVQLGVGWVAGYDLLANKNEIDEDIAALTLLTNQPFHHLLHSYYALPLAPLTFSLLTDILVTALPFALLAPLTRAHDPLTPRTSNQALATDASILLLTSAMAASIFATTFYLSHHALDLGVFLISHFDNLASMSAHDLSIAQLLPWFAVPGFAACAFLFRPTIAAAGTSVTPPRLSTRKPKRFNPATATLGETFAYNLGYGESGWSRRAEVLAKRTAVLSAGAFVNTAVRVFATVEGTDLGGAMGYAGMWAGACVVVAVGFGMMSHED
ncbi:uncharacterized protein LTR77_008821 [Saxophila tyrrhenica]|uniref:Uncharacterized protein n=1 Tax=Saxophila tyrrhenica TaxID=1690608 RepID=A0AAV9P154_9PEZI|nr:hypothetical protein LTR77_008821 [Saxophila tyrrhenica]